MSRRGRAVPLLARSAGGNGPADRPALPANRDAPRRRRHKIRHRRGIRSGYRRDHLRPAGVARVLWFGTPGWSDGLDPPGRRVQHSHPHLGRCLSGRNAEQLSVLTGDAHDRGVSARLQRNPPTPTGRREAGGKRAGRKSADREPQDGAGPEDRGNRPAGVDAPKPLPGQTEKS